MRSLKLGDGQSFDDIDNGNFFRKSFSYPKPKRLVKMPMPSVARLATPSRRPQEIFRGVGQAPQQPKNGMKAVYDILGASSRPAAGMDFSRSKANSSKVIAPGRYLYKAGQPSIVYKVSHRVPDQSDSVTLYVTLNLSGAPKPLPGTWQEVKIAELSQMMVVDEKVNPLIQGLSPAVPLDIDGDGQPDEGQANIWYVRTVFTQANAAITDDILAEPVVDQESYDKIIDKAYAAIILLMEGLDVLAALMDTDLIPKNAYFFATAVGAASLGKAKAIFDKAVTTRGQKLMTDLNQINAMVADYKIMEPLWMLQMERALTLTALRASAMYSIPQNEGTVMQGLMKQLLAAGEANKDKIAANPEAARSYELFKNISAGFSSQFNDYNSFYASLQKTMETDRPDPRDVDIFTGVLRTSLAQNEKMLITARDAAQAGRIPRFEAVGSYYPITGTVQLDTRLGTISAAAIPPDAAKLRRALAVKGRLGWLEAFKEKATRRIAIKNAKTGLREFKKLLTSPGGAGQPEGLAAQSIRAMKSTRTGKALKDADLARLMQDLDAADERVRITTDPKDKAVALLAAQDIRDKIRTNMPAVKAAYNRVANRLQIAAEALNSGKEPETAAVQIMEILGDRELSAVGFFGSPGWAEQAASFVDAMDKMMIPPELSSKVWSHGMHRQLGDAAGAVEIAVADMVGNAAVASAQADLAAVLATKAADSPPAIAAQSRVTRLQAFGAALVDQIAGRDNTDVILGTLNAAQTALDLDAARLNDDAMLALIGKQRADAKEVAGKLKEYLEGKRLLKRRGLFDHALFRLPAETAEKIRSAGSEPVKGSKPPDSTVPPSEAQVMRFSLLAEYDDIHNELKGISDSFTDLATDPEKKITKETVGGVVDKVKRIAGIMERAKVLEKHIDAQIVTPYAIALYIWDKTQAFLFRTVAFPVWAHVKMKQMQVHWGMNTFFSISATVAWAGLIGVAWSVAGKFNQAVSSGVGAIAELVDGLKTPGGKLDPLMLVLVALGLSAAFAPKVVFPAIGKFFSGITDFVTGIFGPRKAGKGIGGRGRPPQVDKLVDEFLKAKEGGNEARAEKIRQKLKELKRRGFDIPGLGPAALGRLGYH